MNAILFVALFTNVPAPARVEAPIELGTLPLHRARSMAGVRCQFVVWPISLVDEVEGTKYFDTWHASNVHCLVRLVAGENIPDADKFIVEGRIRVWDVPAIEFNGQRMEGWPMMRIERAMIVK